MIYALIGFQRVGKTTAAKYIEGKGYRRINFKDALIAEIKKNFPDLLLVLSDYYEMTIDELFEKKPLAVRALLQNYGTEVRRGDKSNYWIEKWEQSVFNLVEDFKTLPNVVVDDVRFQDEAEAVKKLGGKLIRLIRTDITSGGFHASETQNLAIKEDYTILCESGSHDKLYNALDNICK